MKYGLFFVLFLFLILPAAALAKEEYRCPEYIYTEQKLMGPADVEVWQGLTDLKADKANNPEGFSMYDGDPKEGAQLKPEHIPPGKDIFHLESAQKTVWAACTYYGTDVVLAQPLPAGYKKCESTDEALVFVCE